MINQIINKIFNPAEIEKIQGKKRNAGWSKIRKAHIEKNSECAVCGGKIKLQVHHIQPFHLHPDLELDSTNLITLCENGNKNINCHLFFGHFESFRNGYNPNIVEDAKNIKNNILLTKSIKNNPEQSISTSVEQLDQQKTISPE